MSTVSRPTTGRHRTSGETAAPVEPPADSTIHLLDRARRGDRSALSVLIERAAPPVRRWARGRLPSYLRHDANTEDVMQDAVLRTLKNIKNFQHRTVGGLQAYLRKSVVNRIRDLIRGLSRHGTRVELSDELRAEAPSPLETAIMHEGIGRFLEGLQKLKPADRQVIVWRVELGYGIDEIATRLGKSKTATRMTVSRAVARLAKELNLAPVD
jgi:RNA polymerase sigma-70 factor (ECF subfamily)